MKTLLLIILFALLAVNVASAQPGSCDFPPIQSIVVTDFATEAEPELDTITSLLALSGDPVDWYAWQDKVKYRLWNLMWFEIIVDNAGWSDEVHVLDDPDAALIYIYLDPTDIGGAYIYYMDSTLPGDDGFAHGCNFQRVPIQDAVDAIRRPQP